MTKEQDTTDWKAIALALGQRVNFAITNLDSKGAGLFDTQTGTFRSWREYMVEALEMIPGVAVDREVLSTLRLPPAKRRKAQEEIRKRRKSEESKGEQP